MTLANQTRARRCCLPAVFSLALEAAKWKKAKSVLERNRGLSLWLWSPFERAVYLGWLGFLEADAENVKPCFGFERNTLRVANHFHGKQ